MRRVWIRGGRVLGLLVLLALAGGCGSLAQSQQTPVPSATRSISITATSDVPTEQARATSAPTVTPTQLPSPAAVTTLTPVPSVVVPAPTIAGVGGQSSSGGGSVLDRLIQSAKQDLSKRTGAATEEISLVSAAPQEWRDSSLGCPQPGGMYAQVITPGFLIKLAARGSQYEYHTDSTSRVILCQVP